MIGVAGEQTGVELYLGETGVELYLGETEEASGDSHPRSFQSFDLSRTTAEFLT